MKRINITPQKVEFISDNYKIDVKSFVNMVTYLKYEVLGGNFNLPIDFNHESKNIASELKSQKLFPLPKVPKKKKSSNKSYRFKEIKTDLQTLWES